MVDYIRGDLLAQRLNGQTRAAVIELAARTGICATLSVILVGSDPASEIYVRKKETAAAAAAIRSMVYRLPADVSEAELVDLVVRLNRDPTVHGILVQLPLPPHIHSQRIMGIIAEQKDVDGFQPTNVGRLSSGFGGGLVPCTPLGCMMLIDEVVDECRGMTAVVIGKSNIVGKPVALLLLERECTVTVCHALTRDIASIVTTADIVVAAAGSPRLVRGHWVKSGAVLIDVGINRVTNPDGKHIIVGDIAADECGHARALTPVPGGVGPMTVACLLHNTVLAAARLIAEASSQSDENTLQYKKKDALWTV